MASPAADVTGGLNRQLAALSRTLVYTATAAPTEILHDLATVRELDAIFVKKAKRWQVWMIVSIVCAFLSVFISFPLSAAVSPFFLLVPVVLVISAIICGVLYGQNSRRNFDDRRYLMSGELVRHLARDMDPAAAITLSINFNSYHQKRYCTESSGGMFSSVKTYSYKLPWLSMRGGLLDGSKFKLSVTQLVKRKEKRKRKYTKVNESFREKTDLIVVVKPSRYPQLGQFPALFKNAKLPPGLHVREARVDGNRVIVDVLSDQQRRIKSRYRTTRKDADQLVGNHHTVLQLLLAVYHGLAQCRPQRKGA